MGYKRSALLLEWPEESEFAGLEVRMKRLSIRQLMRIEKLSDLRKSDKIEEVKSAMTEMLDAVGEGLLSWNYEGEDGEPVPATREALDDLDVDLFLTLVKTWTKAAAGVPLDSKPSLPIGEPEPPDAEWASFLATSQETSPAPASS
jgi:hypothetical protein